MNANSRLDKLYIAAPCNAKWEDMQGDERVRMCSQCAKNVYNISDMSKGEAEDFLQVHGVAVCMRFYKRRDGTIITDDCPVGLRKLRNGFRFLAKVAASVAAFAISVAFACAKELGCKPRQTQARAIQTDFGSAWDIRKNYFMRFPVAGGAGLHDGSEESTESRTGGDGSVIVETVSTGLGHDSDRAAKPGRRKCIMILSESKI
jgi:hypothetical protein